MRNRHAPSIWSILLLGILLSTLISAPAGRGALAATPAPSPAAGPIASEFKSAAAESGVPEEVLLAVGYVNTHWRMETSEDHGLGIMHLVHDQQNDTLARAAALTGFSVAALGEDAATNIRGGAAILSAAAGDPKPGDINGWRPAVASIGGSAMYADQVFQTLRQGAKERLPSGEEVVLAPQPAAAAPPPAAHPASPDYGPAGWDPASASNLTAASRPSGYIPNRIVIHVTQGSYAGAISHFQNPAAQASAHFVVRSSDGAAAQTVREQDVAWHAGHWDYNTKSIGIEHEGFVDNPSWFTDAMYRASAQLAASIVRKYAIPVDRQHVVGHNEVPDPLNPALSGGRDHHTDPGPHWNWGLYLSYLRAYAGTYCAANGGGPWQWIPGGAYDVGAGASGATWVIGAIPAYGGGGYAIYQWTGANWSRTNGAAVRIAVDPAGVPWVVTAYGDIYKRVSGGWQQVAGRAFDIAVGSDGSTWVVGGDESFGGFGIYRWAGSGWQQIDGAGLRIAAGPAGTVWVVTSSGAIWERSGAGWIQRPGAGYDIGVAAGGRPTVVGTNRVCGGYGLYSWNGSSWSPVPGGAIGVSVGPGGKAWVVSETEAIYKQT